MSATNRQGWQLTGVGSFGSDSRSAAAPALWRRALLSVRPDDASDLSRSRRLPGWLLALDYIQILQS